MEVLGYKCFNKNMTNRYGQKFEVGKTYSIVGKVKFGNNGHGFHMCKRMEDTLRYFDAMKEDVIICFVLGSGEIVSYKDEYDGYYDMFAVSNLKILKQLTREEIIMKALLLSEERVKRFISGYKLNSEEINIFKNKFYNCVNAIETIEYYQEEKLDAFVKKRGTYGRNNNKGS